MGDNVSIKKWKNRDALITAFDDYLIELESVINQRSKYTRRAEGKPMAAIEEPDNPHTTNRGEHMRQAASEAIKIARGLGLNETVTYIGMLLHDAGQPFGAHDGEKTMNIIGEILNTGFYHHNAKGVEVIIHEGLIEKFIDSVPEARDNPELRAKLENDVWYFLELVVGHDGEATSKDIEKFAKEKRRYSSIKEAVLSKVSKANRTDDYKCSVETLEAQISKPADILSYMKSDVLTGFSKGILRNLSDDYLEIIGKLLAESQEETKQLEEAIAQSGSKEKRKMLQETIRGQRILDAKKIMQEIKSSQLREVSGSISDSELEIREELNKYLKKLKENGIDITDIKPEQRRIEEQIRENIRSGYRARQLRRGENKNTVYSQMDKLDDYINKMQQVRKRVVEELMTRVQDALREDYIQATLSRWREIDSDRSLSDEKRFKLKKRSMDFSDKVSKIIYGRNGIKDLNYREYVQYSKKVYQTGCLPKATLKLIKKCSEAIVNTGVIINKFYDPEVSRHIKNGELINLMRQRDIDEEKDKKYRRQIGLIKKKANNAKGVKKTQGRFTTPKAKQSIQRKSLYRDIYRYIQTQEESFARTCEDVYFAIPYTVRSMVGKAVRQDYEENEYLPEEEKKRVNEIRRDLAKKFGKLGKGNITKENLEEYIENQIAIERSQIEHKVAIQICRDYIAGKTDIGIKTLLIKTGMLSKREIEKENIPNEKGNKVVQKLSQDLRDENR